MHGLQVFDAFPQANINVEIKLDSRETADALVALLRRRAQTDPSLFDRVLVGGRHCAVYVPIAHGPAFVPA